jgi:hypothetical protein
MRNVDADRTQTYLLPHISVAASNKYQYVCIPTLLLCYFNDSFEQWNLYKITVYMNRLLQLLIFSKTSSSCIASDFI